MNMSTDTPPSSEPLPRDVFLGDKFLSLNLFIALAVGVPGNILGIRYFLSISPRSRDLPTRLYLSICLVDVLTCTTHIPVLISLLQSRERALFGVVGVCIAWRVIFRGLQLLSVFLVMLLSVTRALVIIRPFTLLRARTATRATLLYVLFLGVQNAALRWAQYPVYTREDGYCYEDLRTGVEVFGKTDDILYELEIGIPTVLITVSFVFSLYSLKLSRAMAPVSSAVVVRGAGGGTAKHSASVTIVLVTAVFLATNLPHVINLTLWNVDAENFKTFNNSFYGTTFMKWYTWNISGVQMVVLNATLSPIVYFFRITGFRDWVLGRMSSPQPRTTVSSLSGGTRRVTDVFPIGNLEGSTRTVSVGSAGGGSLQNGCGNGRGSYPEGVVAGVRHSGYPRRPAQKPKMVSVV